MPDAYCSHAAARTVTMTASRDCRRKSATRLLDAHRLFRLPRSVATRLAPGCRRSWLSPCSLARLCPRPVSCPCLRQANLHPIPPPSFSPRPCLLSTSRASVALFPPSSTPACLCLASRLPRTTSSMAGDLGAASTARTPARTAPKPPAPASSASKQRSIVSFFQKSPAPSPREKVAPAPHCLRETTRANSLPKPKPRPSAKLSTPVPSSDAVEAPSSPGDENRGSAPEPLPSPTTTAPSELCSSTPQAAGQPSPSRKVRSVRPRPGSTPWASEAYAPFRAGQTRRQLCRVVGRRRALCAPRPGFQGARTSGAPRRRGRGRLRRERRRRRRPRRPR